jgi:hypothetical protein
MAPTQVDAELLADAGPTMLSIRFLLDACDSYNERLQRADRLPRETRGKTSIGDALHGRTRDA